MIYPNLQEMAERDNAFLKEVTNFVHEATNLSEREAFSFAFTLLQVQGWVKQYLNEHC